MISSPVKAISFLACLSTLALSAPLHTLTGSTAQISKRTCPGPSAMILLQNQDAHTSAQTTICVDNLADDIPTVFGGSAIDSHDGHFYVTSAHLLSYAEGMSTFCSFQNINGDMFGRVVPSLPDLREWGTLNWGPGLVDFKQARIQCHLDREEYMGCLGISGDVYTQCLEIVMQEMKEKENGEIQPPSTCA